jgi:hypothetical protein
MERTYTTPLLDKLGVRPGARVAVLGIDDPGFLEELATRAVVSVAAAPEAAAPEAAAPEAAAPEAAAPEAPAPEAATDLVFLGADEPKDLGRLGALRTAIYPAGAIWVVSRKGRAATLRDVEVMAAAREAGLVDNKVVSFSPTHTALRLVVPRALR